MTVLASCLRELMAAGLCGEALVEAIARIEAEQAPMRSPRQERNRRYYASKRLKASYSDVSDVSDAKKNPPDPLKENNPSSPPKGGSVSPSEIKISAERIWAAQPIFEGKRRSTRPDVLRALTAATNRGGSLPDVEVAAEAYYRLPGSAEQGGKFAMGAKRLLEADRWREYAPALPTVARKSEWAGPPELRAAVIAEAGRDIAAGFLDHCRWRDVPQRALVTTNAFVARRLTQEIGSILDRFEIQLLVEEAA